jgi:hypothetical protein
MADGTAGMADDERLIADLGRMLGEADPMPDWVVAATRAAITTRTIDTELARLVGDTTDASFEAVRTAAGPRMVSFAGGGVQVDLEIEDSGELIGQLTDASTEGCELEDRAGRRYPVAVDGLGRFAGAVPGPGPIRLHCRARDGRPVATSWITA